MVPEWMRPRTGTDRLMYLAHPHRMKGYGDLFEEYALLQGHEPVNPFAFERGKDGKFRESNIEDSFVGRSAILNLGVNLQRGCGVTGVFGISEGVVAELSDRLEWDEKKSIRVFHKPNFDSPPFD